VNKPTVAIVGRPNVGKSTLFNRVLGGRDAIVSDVAGTTRDRHFGDAEWNGRHFWLVDTGGLMPGSTDSMDVAVRAQVNLAMDEADVVLFVVDGKEGLNPVDREIASQLRTVKRPVLLAVNKLDDYPNTTNHFAFYELGLGDPSPLSAGVGKASGDLLDKLVELLPAKGEGEEEDAIQVAVVGLPNAGKSSQINRLLGEERLVVSDRPGTTRDAIDTPLRYHSCIARSIGPKSACWWLMPRTACTRRTFALPPKSGMPARG
jgi:GTPase